MHLINKFFCALIFCFVQAQAYAQSVDHQLAMPSSGSCALVLTLPVPLGANVTTMGQTGYSLLGKLTFTTSGRGYLNGSVINATFQGTNSPYIRTGTTLYANRVPMVVTAMTAGRNGFAGGYKISIDGQFTAEDGSTMTGGVTFHAVISQDGKTIFLQSARVGTPSEPGVGPGTGTCQF